MSAALSLTGKTDDGAAGDAGGAAGSAGAAAGGGGDGAAVLPDWLKGINDPELQADKVLHRYKDIPTLAKSFSHAQRELSRDKVGLPGKDATPEDWKRFFVKAGLPETADLYKLGKPEKGEVPAEFLSKLAAKGFDLNILPDQMQKLLNWFAEEESSEMAAASEAQAEEQRKGMEKLQAKWGEGFQKEFRKAQRGLQHFATPEQMKHLEAMGLHQDPVMIELFNKVGASLKEDVFKGDVVATLGLTPDEARRKMNDMLSDPNGPYLNGTHAGHQKAVEDYQKYAQAAFAPQRD